MKRNCMLKPTSILAKKEDFSEPASSLLSSSGTTPTSPIHANKGFSKLPVLKTFFKSPGPYKQVIFFKLTQRFASLMFSRKKDMGDKACDLGTSVTGVGGCWTTKKDPVIKLCQGTFFCKRSVDSTPPPLDLLPPPATLINTPNWRPLRGAMDRVWGRYFLNEKVKKRSKKKQQEKRRKKAAPDRRQTHHYKPAVHRTAIDNGISMMNCHLMIEGVEELSRQVVQIFAGGEWRMCVWNKIQMESWSWAPKGSQ